MNKAQYSVSNMQNTQMKTQLKNALGKIDGVNTVNVDLDKGTVEVGHDESVSDIEIRECIEKTCDII